MLKNSKDPLSLIQTNLVFSFTGKVYAIISLKITLVHLLRRFKVTADVSKLTLKMDSLLRPESGHEITIERRK